MGEGWGEGKREGVTLFTRTQTNPVRVGSITIGGQAPVSVQSMCTTDTRDVPSSVRQIKGLEDAGCDIVRVAVPDMEAAEAIGQIKKQIKIPLVADIHFDWRLAVEAINQGVDKVRINPGNIGKPEYTKRVVEKARERDVPIRIGVNAGSLAALKKQDGWVNWTKEEWAKAMVSEAMSQIEILESLDFASIVVSLKANDVERVVLANKLMATVRPYPLHLGITEAGTLLSGLAKSSVAMGLLLSLGLGNTIRVSLTESPEIQVKAAYEILKSLGLRQYGPDIISCPTCGRCGVNLEKLVKTFEEKMGSDQDVYKKLTGKKIAIMGCVVNGPGEARDADIGIAGGKGLGVLIKKGQVVQNIPEDKWVETLIQELKRL